MTGESPSGAGFITTRWTLIDLLNDPELSSQVDVRNELVEMYYPAIQHTLRLLGRPDDMAEEYANAFLVEKVLDKPFFQNADRERGTLRSMIAVSLRNFLIDQHRKDGARPDGRAATLPDGGLVDQASFDQQFNDMFDRAWGVSIMDEVVNRTRRSLDGEGLTRHWEAYERTEINPARHGTRAPLLGDIIDELGFETEQHAASAKKVVKRRMRIFLREVVAETVSNPAIIDDEVTFLRELFGL